MPTIRNAEIRPSIREKGCRVCNEDFLLKEDGGFLLKEDGGKLVIIQYTFDPVLPSILLREYSPTIRVRTE